MNNIIQLLSLNRLQVLKIKRFTSPGERHIWHEFPNRDYHIWCFQMILAILEQLLYISDNLNSDNNNIKSHHILLFERKSGAL